MRNVSINYILLVLLILIPGCKTRHEPPLDDTLIAPTLPVQTSAPFEVQREGPATKIISSCDEQNKSIPSVPTRFKPVSHPAQENTQPLKSVQSDKTPPNGEPEYSLEDLIRNLEQVPDRPKNEYRKIKKGDQVEFLSVFDQGESKEDIRLTAVIRRALIQDDSLSFQAKNIVIITRQGVVTLQGVVSKEQTRLKVIATAERFVPNYRLISKILIGKIRDYQVTYP